MGERERRGLAHTRVAHGRLYPHAISKSIPYPSMSCPSTRIHPAFIQRHRIGPACRRTAWAAALGMLMLLAVLLGDEGGMRLQIWGTRRLYGPVSSWPSHPCRQVEDAACRRRGRL